MNERVLEKARSKVKKNKKVKLGLLALKQWLLQVKSLIILMKTVIFICRGRNAGLADVETYRDQQDKKEQTGTHRDRKGETKRGRNRQGQTGTYRDRQGRTGMDRD